MQDKDKPFSRPGCVVAVAVVWRTMVSGGLSPPAARRPSRAAGLLLLGRQIVRARQRASAVLFDTFKATVLQQNDLLLAALAAASQGGGERRTVNRALGKWRGSTLSGYLRDGDRQTYLENFRVTRERLDALVDQFEGSVLFGAKPKQTGSAEWRKVRRTAKAREIVDPPPARYKLACALYATGQGGPIKVLADAASIGPSTLRKYLEQFADSCTTHLKPIYMPATPWGDDERRAVQDNFAARRGFRPVSLACDGTHIPFKPKGKQNQMEYRNFKGWTSILAVAFVDSFCRFFDIDVGYPGRAGDNTVLQHNWLMRAITGDPDRWLGPGGVILGDSGASDGDRFFLNPFHCPTEPELLWFNFCHSSTRFFVEQAFGMWKSRFRFLLHKLPGVTHKLMVKLIYASAIMHNALVVHIGERVGGSVMDELAWAKFFEGGKSHRCPTCIREKRLHCLHQAAFRNGVAQQRSYRVAPSDLRDQICADAWQLVCAEGVEHRREIEQRMRDACDARDTAV